MRIRAAHVVMVLLILSTVPIAAIVVVGRAWMEPAQVVIEPRAEPELLPMQSNADAKGDRLASRAPPPQPSEPASLALETARQVLLTPPNDLWIAKPPPAKPTTVLLDDKQIASIKRRLKLTVAQEKYWPPVESALKELVLMIHSQRRQPLEKIVDPEGAAVKRLMEAARPFLAQLRQDQRNEITQLVRMSGLGSRLPSSN